MDPRRPGLPAITLKIGATLLAIAPAFALFIYHAAQYGSWLIDDAGISFAYAKNLAGGWGLVAQAGQTPVEGFSNPLWTLLVALLNLLGLFSIPFTPKLVAHLLVLAAFFGFASAMRHILPSPQALLVAGLGLLLTAANPGFVIWCVSGLENPLLACLAAGLLCISIHAIEADEAKLRTLSIQAGLLAAGLALTRPDALLYSAVFPLACLLRVPRLSIARIRDCAGLYAVSILMPVSMYAVFRRMYFGDWAPNTYFAKPGVSSGALGELLNMWGAGFDQFSELIRAIYPVLSVLGLAVPILAAAWAARAWNTGAARKALFIAAFSGVAFVSYLVLPPDWMGEYRFATIAFPVLYLLTLLLAYQLFASVTPISVRYALVGSAGIALLIVSTPVFIERGRHFVAEPAASLEAVAKGATRYNELAADLKLKNPTILAPDLGGQLLLSKLRVVDLAGLCDREFGRLYFKRALPDVFAAHILRNVKPDLVEIHGYWAVRSGLENTAEFRETYIHLGGGDYVRRASLPEGLDDEAARSIAALLRNTDRTLLVRSSLQ